MSTESVVSWANKLKKNLWWRHAIRLAAEKGELGGDDLQLLFIVAKMEHSLETQNESYSDYIAPLDLTGFGEEGQAVTLKSIGKVNHVSALVSDALLQFKTEGLIAVYGDNGSGKSSYAKILKNACLSRGDTPKILSNIYHDKSGDPSAELSVVIAEEQHDVEWALSAASREDLKSIRVFDNTSAAHYISGEDAIEYKPIGMKLLAQLMRSCEFVRAENDNEKIPFVPSTPLPIFRPDSKVFALVSNLSAKTKPEDVDALCIDKKAEESIPVLSEELARLKISTPEKLRKGYSDKCKALQPLLTHLVNLKGKLELELEHFDLIKACYDDYKTKQGAAELARSQAIEGHDLAGICSQEWAQMWSHVKTFVQAHNKTLAFPPTESSLCPTCLQPISGETAAKLKSFDDYLKDQTQVEAKKAKGTFDVYIANLKILNFDLKPYELALSMIRDYNAEYAESIVALNASLETLRDNLVKTEPDFTSIKVDFKAVDWITAQIATWKKKEAEVATDEGLAKMILDMTAQIQDLEDRKVFTAAKQSVVCEIGRLQTLALYNCLGGSCQSTSITTQTNAIANSGAVGALQAAFSAELENLGFDNFKVGTVTRGHRGKQMLKIRLTDKPNGITDVASEGEQKCVALACFLAELTVDNRKSAIIFDDPINSFDHKWRRLFADRIAREALTRQVIVLTHDMAFLKMLEESTDVTKAPLEVVSIRKLSDVAGYPFKEPPWGVKSTHDRVGELKNWYHSSKRLRDRVTLSTK